jgi:hypothetical protein
MFNNRQRPFALLFWTVCLPEKLHQTAGNLRRKDIHIIDTLHVCLPPVWFLCSQYKKLVSIPALFLQASDVKCHEVPRRQVICYSATINLKVLEKVVYWNLCCLNSVSTENKKKYKRWFVRLRSSGALGARSWASASPGSAGEGQSAFNCCVHHLDVSKNSTVYQFTGFFVMYFSFCTRPIPHWGLHSLL